MEKWTVDFQKWWDPDRKDKFPLHFWGLALKSPYKSILLQMGMKFTKLVATMGSGFVPWKQWVTTFLQESYEEKPVSLLVQRAGGAGLVLAVFSMSLPGS